MVNVSESVATPHYTQYVPGFLAALGGTGESVIDSRFAELETGLARLRSEAEQGLRPWLVLPGDKSDLPAIQEAAEAIAADADDVLLLGTGGSSLGARALAGLAEAGAGRPRLHVVDNLSGPVFEGLLRRLDLTRTHILAVSKSGGTVETLASLLVALEAAKSVGGMAGRVTAIVEPGNSILRTFAEAEGYRILDHDPALGGRFSVLSVVGLLPAALLGLDIDRIRDGAETAVRAAMDAASPLGSAPALGAALAVELARRNGQTLSVLMCYEDRLARFADWYGQLWAESLGKEGRGLTPVPALGPVDQHSQVQLYLDGPRDKAFTFVTLDQPPAALTIPPATAAALNLDYLAGRSIADLVACSGRATMDAMAERGLPVREIRLHGLDEAGLGALFAHFMIETAIAGRLLGIDAYDQPAVERGKVLARQYLKEMG